MLGAKINIHILTPSLKALFGRVAEVATFERLCVEKGELAALGGGWLIACASFSDHPAEIDDRGCRLLAKRVQRVAHHGHLVVGRGELDVECGDLLLHERHGCEGSC